MITTETTERRGQGIRRRFPGRPRKFNNRTANAILRRVAKGLPVGVAAAAVGVPASTVSHWIKKGCDDPDGPYAKFSEDIEIARAKGIEASLDLIEESAKGGAIVESGKRKDGSEYEKRQPPQWTAAAWRLERTEPELFGRRSRVEHSGQVTRANVNINVELQDQELSVLSAVLGRLPAPEGG